MTFRIPRALAGAGFCRKHEGSAAASWNVSIAEASDVGVSTVQEVEKIDGEPRVVSTLQWRSDARDEALIKIRSALEKAGITFLPESAHGVGLRGRQKN